MSTVKQEECPLCKQEKLTNMVNVEGRDYHIATHVLHELRNINIQLTGIAGKLEEIRQETAVMPTEENESQ